MRKVLLRIVFDQLFHWESVGNELLVGYGFIISLWVFVAIVSLSLLWRATRDKKEMYSSLFFWAAVPTVIGMIPVLKLPMADSGIPLFGYGMMLTVGFLTATVMASRRARRAGLNPEIIFDLMMWLLIPGIIGARIIFLLQNSDTVYAGKQGFDNVIATIALWDGGIVFYGCIIGGVAGLLIFCRRHEIRAMQLADVLMPSLFIGLGFGRIGCLLFGCCFGAVCAPDMPLGISFPEDSNTFPRLAARSVVSGEELIRVDEKPVTLKREDDRRPSSERELGEITTARLQQLRANSGPQAEFSTVALHPTQLYSSVLAFLLAAFLMWFFRHRPFEGSVLALGWILYPINRFVLEIIRDDEPGRLDTGLTFSQLMSIGLFISGCVLMVWLGYRHKQSGATPPSQDSASAQPTPAAE